MIVTVERLAFGAILKFVTATHVAGVWWLKEAIAPSLSYNRVVALSPPTTR